MSAQDLEQRARELLADEYERSKLRVMICAETGAAIRAIVAALRQQPAPVVDDAMVNRAVAATAHPRTTCLDHYEYAEAVIVAALARVQGVKS